MSDVAGAARVLREAGRALRARPHDEVVAALARVLDAWSDPDGPWQRALVPAHARAAGFSEANVRDALARALAGFTGDAFRAAFDAELGARAHAHGAPLTSLLLAGSIPMPTLLHVVCALAVRTPVLAKPASRDAATLPLVLRSIAEVDAALGRCAAIASFDPARDDARARAFFASECIVASGADATLDAVRARLSPQQSLVGYGHRLSIAVLGPSALDAATARALAVDVADWDQLGCLSPAAVFAVGCAPEALVAFAHALADALEERERAAPRGAVDTAAAAAIRAERESARLRFASADARRAHVLREAAASTVVLEPDARWRAAPLHRFARLHPVASVAALREAVAPIARFLSTIAVAGIGDAEAREALAGLGGHRLCAPGEMQSPPLAWRRDGLGLFAPLVDAAPAPG